MSEISPYIGRRSSRFLEPLTARVWSSGRELTAGRWVVVCWKDRIEATNGIWMKHVGVAGPIEIG